MLLFLIRTYIMRLFRNGGSTPTRAVAIVIAVSFFSRVEAQSQSQVSLRISSPSDGSMFSPGTTVPVTVVVSGAAQFQNGIAVVGKLVGAKEGIMNTAPYTTSFMISPNTPS